VTFCPHPLSTLNNENTKLNTSNAEVKKRGLRDDEVAVARLEIELEVNAAFAVRRIVVRFILLDLNDSFGARKLLKIILKKNNNEQSYVEKKQVCGFIDY
jgi:hypothetical protein